jgi:hypothetical protein
MPAAPLAQGQLHIPSGSPLVPLAQAHTDSMKPEGARYHPTQVAFSPSKRQA